MRMIQIYIANGILAPLSIVSLFRSAKLALTKNDKHKKIKDFFKDFLNPTKTQKFNLSDYASQHVQYLFCKHNKSLIEDRVENTADKFIFFIKIVMTSQFNSSQVRFDVIF